MQPIRLPTLRNARERLAGTALRTPLIRLDVDDLLDNGTEIHLKLENLQTLGSFRVRGAANALGLAEAEVQERGVVTVSTGNMAQGIVWGARRMGAPCRVIVPDHAPVVELEAIGQLGGEVVAVPFDEWWQILESGEVEGDDERLFIHPVSDRGVMAGHGTIGLEIFEDLPEVDTVIVPFDGGGLSCGIASALRALAPNVRVLASEVETSAPLAPSLEAGEPVTVEHRPSFVDGMGRGSLLGTLWPLAREVLAGSLVVSPEEVAEAVRLLVQRGRVVAEGAGAMPLAAALKGEAEGEKIVCVISGGNIDPAVLAAILQGQMP